MVSNTEPNILIRIPLIISPANIQFCDFTKSIITYIKNVCLDEYVHLVGYDSNPYRWMKYCDCFVLPSRFEGLPNALLEAMYLGRPVVAFRCLKIISNMICEGKNGYTCEIENPKELAKMMLEAVKLKNCNLIYKPASKEDFIKNII